MLVIQSSKKKKKKQKKLVSSLSPYPLCFLSYRKGNKIQEMFMFFFAEFSGETGQEDTFSTN